MKFLLSILLAFNLTACTIIDKPKPSIVSDVQVNAIEEPIPVIVEEVPVDFSPNPPQPDTQQPINPILIIIGLILLSALLATLLGRRR